MDEVLVSIICITYNQEKYIRKCLDGFLMQKTNFKYEILVHDDASSDSTAKIIQSYQAKYPDVIKLFCEKENQYSKGKYHIDKVLFPYVRGKYVAYCEGDDFWCDTNKLQRQFDIMESKPNCTICVHRTQKVDVNGAMLHAVIEPDKLDPGVVNGSKFIEIFLQGEGMPFQTSSFFMRSNLVQEDRAAFEDIFHVCDVPMLLWASAMGDLYYDYPIMSCYRVATPGSTNDLMKGKKYAIDKVYANIEGYKAFDKATGRKYWKYMKHRIAYYMYQYYYATRDIACKAELEELKRELNIFEKVKGRVKYTCFGNLLRNSKVRRKLLKK